jgi:(p)ppGpp synthase/HD superfamily hydrolase
MNLRRIIIEEYSNILSEGLKEVKAMFIHNLSDKISEEDIDHIKQLIKQNSKVYSKKKEQHAINVAATVAEVTPTSEQIKSALVHDYVERGGNLDNLLKKGIICQRTVMIVKALSNVDDHEFDGDNEPLEHLKQSLVGLPNDVKNDVITIKIADRLDNLQKRLVIKGDIGNKYKIKSQELLDFLKNEYVGGVIPVELQNIIKKIEGLLNLVRTGKELV